MHTWTSAFHAGGKPAHPHPGLGSKSALMLRVFSGLLGMEDSKTENHLIPQSRDSRPRGEVVHTHRSQRWSTIQKWSDMLKRCRSDTVASVCVCVCVPPSYDLSVADSTISLLSVCTSKQRHTCMCVRVCTHTLIWRLEVTNRYPPFNHSPP